MLSRFNNFIYKVKSKLNLKKTLQLVWKVAPGWTLFSIIMIAAETLFYLLSLYLFKALIDHVAGKTPHAQMTEALMTRYITVAAGVAVVYVIIKSISSYVTDVQAAKVNEFIDDKIHASALSLDLAFYESPAYFDILKRARDAGPERPNAVVTNLVELIKNTLMFIGIGSVLISISWYLLPLMALFIFPAFLVKIKFANRLYALRVKNTPVERQAAYLSSIMTTDTYAKELRSLSLGDYLREWYIGIRLKLLNERLRISRTGAFNDMITSILATICFFASIGFIALQTIRGKTSVGDVTVFMVAFLQSFSVLQGISSGITKLYENNIFVHSIFELFELKSKLAEPVDPMPVPHGKSVTLVVENVSFNYPHSTKAILKNISLTIPSGKLIAVVGLNGSGKTTLIKLLCRLYDPTQGKITFGGTDIRNLRCTDYRREVSTIFQDFGRYNVSVADNIRFGNIGAVNQMEAVVQAAKKSGAHKYIVNLPQGYDTMMGRIFEGGQEVSIGQWQKLAIARSYYNASRFLIMDEATSALDAKSEKELFDSLRESIGDKGALIISHRMSAVEHADYIYVMADGEIKEQGTHDDLIAKGGEYAMIFKNSPLKRDTNTIYTNEI